MSDRWMILFEEGEIKRNGFGRCLHWNFTECINDEIKEGAPFLGNRCIEMGAEQTKQNVKNL